MPNGRSSAPPQHDFDTSILSRVAHRPWPVPSGPWIMTQTWHNLLFAHWPIDPDRLVASIPSGLNLDLHDGRAWLGIVPFYMTNVAPRGVPALPWVSAFPELNVRTYVRLGDKPGVFFFSLDAGSPLAVAVARTIFHLPYHLASMHVTSREDGIHYSSRRHTSQAAPAQFIASYASTGPIFEARPGSLEYFLTERYCLYTVDRRSRILRLEILHPPWPLQAASAEIALNTMADAVAIRLPSVMPLLHFARRQDVVAWPAARVTSGV